MIPSCYALHRRFLRIGCAAAILFVLSDDRTAIARQTGIQRTQDGNHILVNKDVSAERWAISRNDDGTLTGNVFRADGGAPAFIFCAPLEEPNAFHCSGADPCSVDGTPRGIQGTPDGKRVLVNKDVGAERWAIGRNDDGTVTGNVFRADEGPPAFISCAPLAAPNSFRCSGADACVTEQCTDQYVFIADVTLPTDFFTLPVPCGSGYTFIADVTLPPEFFDPASALECDASCVETQAGSVVARTQRVLEIGVAAVPTSSATIAGGATSPCDEGFSTEDEGGFTDVDCRIGDLVSNGSVAFTDIPPTQDRQATFAGFSVKRISTGETLISTGTLVISPQETGVKVNGTVTRSSTLLGDYHDVFTDVVANTSGDEVLRASGTIVTTVTRGLGEFTGLKKLEGTILGPQLAIVVVTFQDEARQPEVSIISGDIGLCDACTTNADCDAQLECVPCVGDCTGTTKRCSVGGSFTATCADGDF